MNQTKAWRQKGFTLIELMIVLALLGLLALLAVPGFGGLKTSAANRVAESNLRVIQSAYQLAKSIAISTGELPEDDYEVTVHIGGGNSYESYFNSHVDKTLPEELLGNYDITDQVSDGAESYLIHYYQDGETYVLEDGLFYKESSGPPADPIEQVGFYSQAVAEDMVDLTTLLKDKSSAEKKQYFIDQGLTNVDNNLGNDTYRRFLYEIAYGGAWPEMTEEFKDYYGLTATHLYIQPFVCDVNSPEDVVVFANSNSTSNGNWYTNLIYYEGQWYTGPSFSINSAGSGSKQDIKDEMDRQGYQPLQPVT